MQEGQETGTCSCCGRTLTNELSISLGIGPICREGWFPAPATQDTPELADLDLDLDQLGDVVQDELDISLDSLNSITQGSIVQLSEEELGQLEVQEIVAAFARLSNKEQLDCFNKMVEIISTKTYIIGES